jgi:hypothetical protein
LAIVEHSFSIATSLGLTSVEQAGIIGETISSDEELNTLKEGLRKRRNLEVIEQLATFLLWYSVLCTISGHDLEELRKLMVVPQEDLDGQTMRECLITGEVDRAKKFVMES